MTLEQFAQQLHDRKRQLPKELAVFIVSFQAQAGGSDTGSQGGDLLLEVKNLQTQFATSGGVVRAVDGVSWDVRAGETVALVGESGSCKTTIGRCIAGLHVPAAGTIAFDGRSDYDEFTKAADVLGISYRSFRHLMKKYEL